MGVKYIDELSRIYLTGLSQNHYNFPLSGDLEESARFFFLIGSKERPFGRNHLVSGFRPFFFAGLGEDFTQYAAP